MIILTAVGRDRPGMAHAVAQILADAGCNIEDTTMTRLAGEFAMILIVTPPAEIALEDLQSRLAPLENSHGLYISIRDIPEEVPLAVQDAPRFIVSAYGLERAGLLAGVTDVLAEHSVNITDVQTRVASAGTVYIMIFEVELPPTLELDTLHTALETAGKEIGVTVNLRAMEEDTL
jgi:glycine cleavage system transcriptional repressor